MFFGNQFYESITPRVVKAYGMLSEYAEWKTVSVCVYATVYCPTREVISPFSSTPAQLAAGKHRQWQMI